MTATATSSAPGAGTIAAGLPYQASPSALARAVVAAGVGAAAILTLFVLPAEWGIDPTGVGKALGLTRMAVGADPDGGADTPAAPGVEALVVPAQTQANIQAAAPWRSDTRSVTLAPHSGIEIKAHMNKGDRFVFRWSSSGPIRMDMHGEPKGATNGEFTQYWKQKNLTTAQGSFTAPFAGTHGWYWRNGGEAPVTIKLDTQGFYQDLFEPAAE